MCQIVLEFEEEFQMGMEKDVGEHMVKCLMCLQVKAEHQRSLELFWPLSRNDSSLWTLLLGYQGFKVLIMCYG